MSSVPRLAIGTVQADAVLQPMVWAVLDALDREGVRIQNYLSRACFAPIDAATSITGVSPRHLDSWLMSAEQCRWLFSRTARESDVAVLEGRFETPGVATGGQLEPLCQWLGVPQLAVVDVAVLHHCVLPPRPARATGLLLDRVSDSREFCRWKTMLESLWGVPVLGALEPLPELRSAIDLLEPGQTVSRELCRTLGNILLKYCSASRLLAIAGQGDFPLPLPAAAPPPFDEDSLAGLKVAVAYDDVFNCYFPDALDALEGRGATVTDFSPLRDESLPADADLVVIGCGHPERYAAELGENHCMSFALRDHLCAGKRIYAEGGGLAYLCQSLETSSGEVMLMAGLLPAVARMNRKRSSPRPAEITLGRESWLGPAGGTVRGYLNESWSLEPTGRLTSLASHTEQRMDLLLRHQAVGSRLHLNLAAQPQLLRQFLKPCPAALAWAGA